MAETKIPFTEEYNNLKQQFNALSQEKADLEILRDLINKLSPVAGLENLISHILTVAMDIAGSEKVTAYYRLDKHCVSIDAYGKKNEFDCFDDPLVIESIEKLAIIEKPAGKSNIILVFPLIVGENIIGAVKIENITGNSKEIQWKLQPFMNYVAVILNNEISSSSKLNTAYLQLQETNAKLQEELNKHVKTEEQLQEKSDTLKTIFESIQVGVVIINPETHKIVYANPFAVKMIRAPREKIVGAECHKFICPAEKGKCPVTDLGQNVDNSERILITADWEERPIIKTVSHVNINGRKHLLETFVDITERKLAEEALQESKEKYKTLIQNLNVGIYRNTAPKGAFIQANPAIAKIFGYESPEEFLKISALDLYQNPEDRNLFIQDVKRDGFVKNRELALKKKDGTPIWCSCTAVAKYDKEGKIQWIDGIVEDITQRKKADEEKAKLLHNLNERVKELDCLYGISRLVDTPEITLEEILQGTTNLIPPAWQYPEITCSRIIFENKEFKTNNFKNTKLKQTADIKAHKEKVGSIEVCLLEKEFKDNRTPFSKEENILLETIAERIGKTIERKKTAVLLSESRDRLEKTQEMAHLGSWELDVVNNVLTWSDEAYRIFGLKPQEFKATYEAFLNAVHPDDRAAVDAAYSGSLREGKDTYRIEHRIVRKSTGEIRIVYEKCEHIRDASGKVIRSVGMVHDITNRKLAEKALLESAEEWHRTFDSISDLIFIQDNDHVILRANKAFCDALKSRPEDIVGKRCYEILHKTNSPWPNCPFEKTKEDQEAHTEEVDDKNIGIPLLVTTSPIFNEKGELIGSVHTAKDISEHKEAEKKLLESEQQMRLLLNSTGEAIYGIDLQGNCTFVNPSCLRMIGYADINQLLGKNMHKLIHHSYPDGRPMDIEVCRIYKALRAGRGEHIDDEVLWRADGTSFPVEYWSYPQIIDGKVHGAVMTFVDITERKKSEEELAFKNALLSTQQETSIDGILVVDATGKVISFNKRFVDMWNIPQEIIETRSDERVLQSVLKQLEDPIPFLTKVRYLYEHRDETSRDEIALIDGRTFDRYSASMFGPKRKYYGRVWYFRNVTDQKQAEEKLIEMSLMDELTGLSNRRGFSVLAAKQIKNADRYKHDLTLIYIDLDNMKWINDNLGHKEGDNALADISNIFKNSFRASDIIARLGGDEFAGLVVDSRGTTSDMILARMQEGINELNSQKIRPYGLSISFGSIRYDHKNPCSLNELIERGDKAMYEHKQKKGVRRGENIK